MLGAKNLRCIHNFSCNVKDIYDGCEDTPEKKAYEKVSFN